MATPIPTGLKQMLAQRERRIHHYLWHTVREGWEFFTDLQRQAIHDLGWEPPRPAIQRLPDGGRTIYLDNDSGEDFLYMHRQMIFAANLKLAEIGDPTYPRIEGWGALPPIDDSDYPVPSAWDTGDPDFNAYLQESKSDAFFQTMLDWQERYSDSTYLRTMSLGELGARLEFTIHNRMHIRWCREIADTRPDTDPTNPHDIDAKWDVSAYDWLADTYSSHVHSTFWRLHGWIDQRIEDWASANGVTGPIAWKGTWVGRMPPHPAPESLHATLSHAPVHHDHQSVMKQVLKIVLSSDFRCHFYDPVDVPQ